eukprot:Awhi_evm1s13699
MLSLLGCEGALDMLRYAWTTVRRTDSAVLQRGHYFDPYSKTMLVTDRRLIPEQHSISIYPPDDRTFR